MFGTKDIVGLDIGSHSIKLVRLKKGKKGFELLNFGIIPIPPETIVDGLIEKPEIVTNAIKNIFKTERIKTKEVVTAISGESVVIKKINVPKMTEDELAESIRVEAEQYIPFDIEEVNLDFQIIKETGAKEAEKEETGEEGAPKANMDVLLVAARKELVEGRNKPIIDADLKPVIVDLDVFAMENGYEFNYGVPVGELSHDINKMFHDFIKSTGKNINRVILSGGCARIHGIEKILTENFHIPTEIINPYKNIKVNHKVFDPQYIQEMAPLAAIGVGLAMRRLKDKAKPS